MIGSVLTAGLAHGRRPSTLCLAAGLLAGGGSAATVVSRHRSREPDIRDLLHHRLLPSLHAAERAVAAEDVDAATRHLRDAVVLSRTALDPAGAPPSPVLDAVEEARRVWADELLIDDDGVAALPSRLQGPTRRALHAITLESLANVAHHTDAPIARVSTGLEGSHVVLTVAASEPQHSPSESGAHLSSRSPRPTTEEAYGYGLPSLERIAKAAGGSLETSFTRQGSVVVARLPSRRSWSRR